MNVDYPFRQWLPDLADLNNPGLVEAKNVYRKNGAYHPIHEVSFPGGTQSYDLGVSNTSNTTIANAISASESGVEFYCFCVATTSTITLLSKEVNSATVSSTAAAATVGSEVCNFVNHDGNVYFFDRVGDQFKSIRGAAFSNVASTGLFNPSAAATVGEFMMIGRRFQIKWSGFNAPEDWTISQRTQAGEATLNEPSLGFITGITGGRTNLIFQEHGVSRLEYVGVPLVWRVTTISSRQGAILGSPVDVGGMTYFLGASNTPEDSSLIGSGQLSVYKTNGVEVVEVEGVSDWLTANFTTGSQTNSRKNVAYDRARNQIIWASNTGEGTHKFLCMNVATEEFTYFEASHQSIIPGPYHDPDNAGLIMVVTENPDGNLYQAPLGGDALEATLTTGHITSPGERVSSSSVEVHYSGSGATVALSGKDRYGAASDFGSYATPDATTGFASVRAAGRALAASVKIPSGSTWDDLSGLTVNLNTRGQR